MNVARIEVSRVWKGAVDAVVTVSNEAGSSCSFDFSVGQRFLVYGTGARAHFAPTHARGAAHCAPAIQNRNCRLQRAV
jgi:hypothetical protein